MQRPHDSLIHAFSAQFRELNGFVFYRRLSYWLPMLGRGDDYIVTSDERDRFIAEFSHAVPMIFDKIQRDLWLAGGSFILSTMVLQHFFGDLFEPLEMAVLMVHVAVIVVVENRRLHEQWDAPAKAMAGRAPMAMAVGGTPKVFLPLSKFGLPQLGTGAFMGAVALYVLPDAAVQATMGTASPDEFLPALLMGIPMLFIGVVCVIEMARRLLRL